MPEGVATFLQTMINGVSIGAVYAVIAMGLALTFGVLKVINFAHGEFVMIGMYSAFGIVIAFGADPYVGFIPAMLICLALGAASYWVLFRRIEKKPQEDGLLLSLGLALVLSNFALVLFSPDYRTVNSRYASLGWQLCDLSLPVGRMITLITIILVTILLFLFLQHTHIGRSVRAASQDRDGAALAGVNVQWMSCLALSIGSALCGIAGALLLPSLHVYPSIGSTFTIKAFVVVVLGGLGNIPGALVAGLFLGMGESLAAVYVSPDFKDALGLILFLFVLLVRPQGLMVRKRIA